MDTGYTLHGPSTPLERLLMRAMYFCDVRAGRLFRARLRPNVVNRVSRRERFWRFIGGQSFAALKRRGWMADHAHDRYIRGPRPLPREVCRDIIHEAQRMAQETR